VAVCDANAEVSEKIGQKYHAKHYTDFKEMLKEESLDLVSIAVPTSLHKEVALEAINQGVNVLLEKPLAENLEQGEELVKAAEQSGIKFTVGFIERFNPAITELKRQLEAGRLGKLYKINVERISPFPARINDVGVIVDLATHDIDIINYLCGLNFESVYAETQQLIHPQCEDSLIALLRAQDIIATLNINWLTPTKKRKIILTGEKGMFEVNYLTQEIKFYENASYTPKDYSVMIMGVAEGNVTKIKVDKKEPLKVELESFVESVLNNTPPLVNAQHALHTSRLVEKIKQSALEKKVTPL
jgi:predicted dehydrogenase